MASSVIVAAKQALVALLQARPALAGIQISYGWPGDDVVEKERIYTDRSRGQTPPASLRAGRTHRNEDSTFEVVVQVEKAGGTAAEADLRALVLGLQIEECVADNRTLGGVSGLNWAIVADWDLDGFYNSVGRGSQLVYTIQYNARLT